MCKLLSKLREKLCNTSEIFHLRKEGLRFTKLQIIFANYTFHHSLHYNLTF